MLTEEEQVPLTAEEQVPLTAEELVPVTLAYISPCSTQYRVAPNPHRELESQLEFQRSIFQRRDFSSPRLHPFCRALAAMRHADSEKYVSERGFTTQDFGPCRN